MKHATLFLVALVLLCAATGELFAQDQSSPLAVVNLFKAYIDNGNIAGMLSIYGDVDADAAIVSCAFVGRQLPPARHGFVPGFGLGGAWPS